nr:MAG TPA: hypothetical protein [Caudoviricetes sp.]
MILMPLEQQRRRLRKLETWIVCSLNRKNR